MFLLEIDDNAYTLELIRESRDFVIAYPSGAMAKEMLTSATYTDTTKTRGTKCGLQFTPAEKIDVPPLADAVVHFE